MLLLILLKELDICSSPFLPSLLVCVPQRCESGIKGSPTYSHKPRKGTERSAPRPFWLPQRSLLHVLSLMARIAQKEQHLVPQPQIEFISPLEVQRNEKIPQ